MSLVHFLFLLLCFARHLANDGFFHFQRDCLHYLFNQRASASFEIFMQVFISLKAQSYPGSGQCMEGSMQGFATAEQSLLFVPPVAILHMVLQLVAAQEAHHWTHKARCSGDGSTEGKEWGCSQVVWRAGREVDQGRYWWPSYAPIF